MIEIEQLYASSSNVAEKVNHGKRMNPTIDFWGRVLTKVLKWWVPGLITFENGESHQILVSPNPKMMSPDFSYNKPLSKSLTFHKSWVHAVSFKCIYKLK